MFDFKNLANQELINCRKLLAELFSMRDEQDNVTLNDFQKHFYNKYFDKYYSLNGNVIEIENVIILHNKISHEMADRFERSLGSV